MIQTAPDVKPLLPGRHPFLPRQPPAALPTMTPMMTPQMAPLPMLPSSPRYLSPVQESRIDAWRKTTSAGAPSAAEHEAPAVPAPPPPPHSCPNCGPPSAHDKKSKSAPASLAPKSYRSHHQHSHPHSCADSSEAGTRSAGTSQVQTASPVDSRHATGPAYVNDPPSPISGGSYGRSYYSTKKHRHARREQRMASQSAPHPGASQPLDAASVSVSRAPSCLRRNVLTMRYCMRKHRPTTGAPR